MSNLALHSSRGVSLTITKHFSERDSCCHLDETLDLVQSLSVRRIANPKTIKRKSTISVLVSCDADVGVVVVVVRKIPVSNRRSEYDVASASQGPLTFYRIQCHG